MHLNASEDRTPSHTAAGAARTAVLALIAAVFLALAASAPNLTRVAAGRADIPADPPAPLPQGLVIPSYAAGPMPLHPGEQLVFRASWIGIPAAEARILVSGDEQDPRLWKGEVWVRTSPGVDLLYKLRDYLHEEFSRASMAPRALYIKQSENQRNSEYRLSFDRSARVVTAVKRNKRGSATSRFASDNPFGPVSGAIMALSQPLRVGQKLRFDVFTARSRYVIDFTVAGRERISTPLGDFDALRVIPAIAYMSDESAHPHPRRTTLWISADKRHLPLRIETTAFVGKLRAELIQIGNAPPLSASPEATPSPTERQGAANQRDSHQILM